MAITHQGAFDQSAVNDLLATFVPGPVAGFTAVSTNTPTTLSAASMVNAQDNYINMTATLAGAGTLNTPTAVALITALQAVNPAVGVGYSVGLRVINSSGGAFAWTLTAGTGVTITGTASIAQNTFRDFVLTVTSLTAQTVTIQQVGTGTTS
jgi:hypothetical protein